jgi:hypothetical protein
MKVVILATCAEGSGLFDCTRVAEEPLGSPLRQEQEDKFRRGPAPIDGETLWSRFSLEGQADSRQVPITRLPDAYFEWKHQEHLLVPEQRAYLGQELSKFHPAIQSARWIGTLP